MCESVCNGVKRVHWLCVVAREAELRQLRKNNMEYEERNAALQKHVESMRSAVERLEGDVHQERTRNGLLQQHLDTLRSALTHSFSAVPLPGETLTHTHTLPEFTAKTLASWGHLSEYIFNMYILIAKVVLILNVLEFYIIYEQLSVLSSDKYYITVLVVFVINCINEYISYFIDRTNILMVLCM